MIAASCDRRQFVGRDQVYRRRNYPPEMDWIEFQRARGSIRVKPNGRCERFLEEVERRRPSISIYRPSLCCSSVIFLHPRWRFPQCVQASTFHLTFPSNSSAPWSTVWAFFVAFTRLPILWSTESIVSYNAWRPKLIAVPFFHLQIFFG